MKTTEFLTLFLEAYEELKNVKMAIVSLKHQVAVARNMRSVAHRRARRRSTPSIETRTSVHAISLRGVLSTS